MGGTMKVSHYKYLDIAFPMFLKNIGHGDKWEWNCGIVTAHGDKGYSYRNDWEERNIPFHEGMVLYLLTYMNPWANEARNTNHGFIDPKEWVINNYDRFKNDIPKVGIDINYNDVKDLW
jgi:hypothetical protein